ncbi:MAG: hypothetical protein JWM68_158 [Verrucomicrobiales bacterium]|nr:hypothetical protein [Verrucomicrobiales bacterium]
MVVGLGLKLSFTGGPSGRSEKRHPFEAEAEAKGLQGREKHEYMCQGLNLSKQTDERTPRPWAEDAEKLGL